MDMSMHVLKYKKKLCNCVCHVISFHFMLLWVPSFFVWWIDECLKLHIKCIQMQMGNELSRHYRNGWTLYETHTNLNNVMDMSMHVLKYKKNYAIVCAMSFHFISCCFGSLIFFCVVDRLKS